MIFSKSLAFDEEGIGRAGVASINAEEDQFVARLKAGDTAAFERLVDDHSREIFSLLYNITGDREESSDLTQETFLRAFRSIGGFRGGSSLKTWLYRIAVNESRNRFRWWKRRRRDLTLSLDDDREDRRPSIHDSIADKRPDPERTVLSRERESSLKAALDDLPEAFREAVVLTDVQGLTYEETAAVMGTNIGTVKSRVARGRQALRLKLKDI
jgi:RNA polymerase sigma-70 factor, ECF subfamily